MNAFLTTDCEAAVLMLDLDGYSKLRDWSVREWLGTPLDKINRILVDQQARYKNTWGDGIIAVFTDDALTTPPGDADAKCGGGGIAAERAAIAARDILKYCQDKATFATDLKIDTPARVPRPRLALHYGKVSFGKDAVRGDGGQGTASGQGCCGNAINHCARVEPVVWPGYAFCTKEFSEKLSVNGPVECRALGEVALAKGAGRHQLFTLASPGVGATSNRTGEVLPGGVATRDEFDPPFSEQADGFPGEVFAIELLTRPVTIEPTNDGVHVLIDRRDADPQVLITNEGKKCLFEADLPKDDKGREALVKEDTEIQQVMLGHKTKHNIELANYKLDTQECPRRLRWASGGVLSVVTIKSNGRERRWVPLFFRDIRPYGWNIALGSTERVFKNGHRPHRDIETDWNRPLRSSLREFFEETLILAQEPKKPEAGHTVRLEYRMFQPINGILNPFDSIDQTELRTFGEKHRDLRKRHDNIDLSDPPKITLTPKVIDGNAELIVTPPADLKSSKVTTETTKKVFVCFSLMDLGVEVVTALSYELTPDDYLLDGEIRGGPDQEEGLVRQPVALFSCDYLRTIFAGDAGQKYDLTKGVAPSVVVPQRPTPPNDVKLFEWDVRKRMEVVTGVASNPAAWQTERFTDWYDKFGPNFVDEHGRPRQDKLPTLFVPATAKILEQYFHRYGNDPPVSI